MEKIDTSSRFQNTPPVLVEVSPGVKVETFGPWVRPSFLRIRPTNDKIGKYSVNSSRAGLPHLIAEDIYGTQYLDWILIAFNNAYDCLNWPQPGVIIEYPVASIIFAEIE